MNIVIVTTKSWNIRRAQELKEKTTEQNILIISEKRGLTKERLSTFNPQYVFFPHWSYIIPEEIYNSFECVVFHMTDLPYGRGGSPLQNLIVRGHKDTMISALRVTGEIDAGPIYMKTPLQLDGSAEEIYGRASEIIFQIMIPEIINNQPIPMEQQGQVVSFKRRRPEEGELKPGMELSAIYDYIRMLDAEGYPNAYIEFGQNKLQFQQANIKEDQQGEYIEAKVIIRRM